MGKQSRKKSSKKGSKGQKAKENERREKRDQRANGNNSCEGQNGNNGFRKELLAQLNTLTILEGDRVWIVSATKTECENENGVDDPGLRRGVVKKLGDDGIAEVQTLASVRNGDQCIRKIPLVDLTRDFGNLTLRFQVGDQVICFSSNGALPGVVTYLWPVWEHKKHGELIYVPCYEVMIHPSKAGQIVREPFAAASFSENEDTIMKRPEVFRFSRGNQVLIDWEKARFPSVNAAFCKNRFAGVGWIRATISEVDALGEFGYAAYECIIDEGTKARKITCYVLKDQNEFIVSVSDGPRERLFTAIEKDCSFEHINYLIDKYSIDVSLILELVTSKVIEYGNFGMFRWLEEKQNVDLSSLSFPEGNSILHEICRTSHASRFLQNYAHLTFNEKKIMYRPSLDQSGYLYRYAVDSSPIRVRVKPPLSRQNDHGETWLHVLIKKGDLRAIDCALSLVNGLFWILRPCDFRDLKSDQFKSNSTDEKIIEFLIDGFISKMTIFRQVDLIYFSSDGNEDKMQDFCPKKFIRFVRQWRRHHPDFETYQLDRIVRQVLTNGFSKLFRKFIDGDNTIVKMQFPSNRRIHLDKLFVQPELYNDLLEENEIDGSLLSVTEVAAEGKIIYKPRGSVENYIRFLVFVLGRRLSREEKFRCEFSLLSSLKERYQMTQNTGLLDSPFFKHQIDTLEDDVSIPGRVEILDLLVREHEFLCPTALHVVKTRQRGVLSWMLRRSFVKLDSKASLDKQLNASDARKLEFLGTQPIPANISSGSFLAFACVEYDSLHVLSLLSKDEHVVLDCFINGFTLLHACAYFGRLEIILWFYTRPEWNIIAAAFASRKGFEGATAVHVAVKRGHIYAADLLLTLGSPSLDKTNVSHGFVASKSTFQFVRKWGESQAKPGLKDERIGLIEDVQKLLGLVVEKSYDTAKKFITSSKCMGIDRWRCAGIHHALKETLFGGNSYEVVLLQCMNGHDEGFVCWLCASISSDSAGYEALKLFWHSGVVNRMLDLRSVLETVHQSGDKILAKLLSDPSMFDIKVRDPSVWLPQTSRNFVKQHIVLYQIYHAMLIRIPVKAKLEVIKGGDVNILEDMATSYRRFARKVAGGDDERFYSYFEAYGLFTATGERYVNLNVRLDLPRSRDKNRSSSRILPFLYDHVDQLPVHMFIAMENYSHILDWWIQHGEGWRASYEVDIIRIGAYLGHDEIITRFLNGNDFFSSRADRQKSAILGFAEAGREREWRRIVDCHGLPLDQPPFALVHEKGKGGNRDYRKERKLLLSSHSVSIVLGYLSASEQQLRKGHQAIIKFLLESGRYSPLFFLEVILLLFELTFDTPIEHLTSLVNFMYTKRAIFDPTQDPLLQHHILRITNNVLRLGWTMEDESQIEPVKDWLASLETWSVDIQSLECSLYDNSATKSLNLSLLKLQEEQKSKWAELDIVKRGGKLSEIKATVRSKSISFEQSDQNGLSLIHLASSFNRVDILEWLVVSKKVDIRQKDRQGRTALDIAKASQAATAAKWIEEKQAITTISSFLMKNQRRRLAAIRKSRIALAASKIQALQRGVVARTSFRGMLLLRVEESLRFNDVWEHIIRKINVDAESPSWSSIRNRHESRVSHLDDLDDILKTSEKLDAASISAMGDEYNDESSGIDRRNEKIETIPSKRFDSQLQARCEITIDTKIMLTEYVRKWLVHADEKYREFFVRRLEQLQRGDRSRILAKRLKGSVSTIFETYLEQKSGHRILWRNEENGTILIWFVAKHKDVSRLMQLIDDSESRSARQRISFMDALPEIAISEMGQNYDQNHRVVLNPLGNVPLKVYELESLNVEEVKGDAWSPRLYLSPQERGIIECNGSVLLLGRSGTGKTVCICNRMDLDVRRFGHNAEFSQLFVARSRRLCRYVAESVGFPAQENTFTTFRRLVQNLEDSIPRLISEGDDVFLTSRKMDFARFKRDVYGGSSTNRNLQIDPLLVYTNIRTFCKGSIEALQAPNQILGKDDFLELGERRCRLGKTHREFVYDIFLRYQKTLSEQNLWDDCDRITALILRLQEARRQNGSAFDKIHRSKIYVDEIQDYTQAEVCLFFLLSGTGDLFMAGDPAQSVVEGVEFRFEDIRSVAYHLSNPGDRDLIPEKPKVVTVNFRSHSGVMDTAAAILRCMFDAFPYSAKQLGEDRGLFTGPRPGVFHPIHVDRLRTLICEKLNGVVVLTHDSSVRYWKKALGNYQLVYGIRAAKGLEFKSVIILDFFCELPQELQKPWRNLLLGRDEQNAKPELEGQLKLLYTAVTRCIEQLFFAETSRSSSGDAFVRWLTTTSIRPKTLATRQSVDDVEKMVLTQDEWVASGLDNAELAESTQETNLEESLSLMEKARFCFQHGKEEKLSRRARTHRAALIFRRDLVLREMNGGTKPVIGTVEFQVARLMDKLLSEDLRLEALRVVKFALPYLGDYPRDRLGKIIMPKLRAMEQENL
mmetsp:Transcript_14447/g.40206  ORF Transcript_14447/g.40206 Transcript_14447/m.40206 type:complete len:2450 (-) Transcript_14447:2893-10242(-)|eukprot:CAMPEP_0172378518 /NCGR_PEP_ID=MMETSP1060-20121228/69460_1 /TAXON_ID=37318 /ORGANISM="Pseudo-nitzschia pungens, Strain cf. cingulata" /LENGTH=2449 /DNA_ID=CAMNT_0013106239 /DNA_START=70 /DNA_END=7419 /DNA_ORIENTATION=-